jgi:hypothetical protein
MRLSPPAMCLTLSLIAAAAIAAQGHSEPTPQTPDLLGIYPGMPMLAARAQLQRHSKAAQVITDSDPDSGFGLMIPDPANRDQVKVFLTRAPNDAAVWMIQRSQNFSPQSPMSQAALLAALHDKYGKETLTMDRGGGGLYLFWIFDSTGKLRVSADQGLTGCSGSSFINYISVGPPQSPNTIEQACFRAFFAVTAMLNRRDAQMLEAYTVELVNLPYALEAATNTRNASGADAERARQDQLRKANQNKPKF